MDLNFKLVSVAWVQVIKSITSPAVTQFSYSVRLNLHPLRKYLILKSSFTVSLRAFPCIHLINLNCVPWSIWKISALS